MQSASREDDEIAKRLTAAGARQGARGGTVEHCDTKRPQPYGGDKFIGIGTVLKPPVWHPVEQIDKQAAASQAGTTFECSLFGHCVSGCVCMGEGLGVDADVGVVTSTAPFVRRLSLTLHVLLQFAAKICSCCSSCCSELNFLAVVDFDTKSQSRPLLSVC